MADLPISDNEKREPQKVEDIFEVLEGKKGKTPEIPEKVETQPDVSREVAPEIQPESEPAEKVEEKQSPQKYVPSEPAKPSPAPVKSEDLLEIENVLSEHLDEIYMTMTPQQQMAFRDKGEETASKISVLLRETKIKVKEILDLIKSWLQIIPGINKFFLEQEAKIKTDRLLNLQEQKNKQK
ncbi:hypothetical protein IID19_03990 [Patescibacteria group bacterium]|nr:hypothetical protein [Patescibacteria group bacterium]